MGNGFEKVSLNKSTTTTKKKKNRTTRVPVKSYVSLDASDSIGFGTSNPSEDGWVPQFAAMISAEQTISLGRIGSTICDARREQLPHVFAHQPDLITIWLAVNDFNEQVSDPNILQSYSSNLNEILKELRTKFNRNVRILVGNIPDLSQIEIYQSVGIPKLLLKMVVKKWNSQIATIVKQNQCELVDLYSNWRELAAHPEYVSFDGFHPSKEGYQRLAQIFYEKYLK